jgi:hypothetical protein
MASSFGGDAMRGSDGARQCRERFGERKKVMAQGNGARSLMDRAREGAFSKLDSQRERAATGIGSMVDALRESGRQLEGQNATVASYVSGAAAQLDRFSGTVRDRDVNEMVRDVERFARQRPALFLGGAFVLGVAAARFLKSSGETSVATGGQTSRAPAFATRPTWPDESVAATLGGERTPGTASNPTTSRPTARTEWDGAPASR